MKRRNVLWLGAALILAALPIPAASGGAMTDVSDETRRSGVLARVLSSPKIQGVVGESERHRLQISLGLLEEASDGTTRLDRQTFRVGAEYFYPASTVKLFAAVAAAQKVSQLRDETGLPIDLGTRLVYHPLFEDDVLEKSRPNNVETGWITVGHAIREIFLVSDNQAYNYLYELVGQDGLAESLRVSDLLETRIVHRLSEFRSPEQHRQLPRIDFVGQDFAHTLPARNTAPLPPPAPLEGLRIGKAYYRSGKLVAHPMDFSTKNNAPLAELQTALCMLVKPTIECGGKGIELPEADREVMLEAMSQLPRESNNPLYDPSDYPDEYVKEMLLGLERVRPAGQWRIYNKTGRAYGFSTENAWIVDTETGKGFFLAATLYTNANETLNDDDYEYDEVATPFFADLAELVAAELGW